MTQAERRARFDEIVTEPLYDPDAIDVDHLSRYLLIERSRYDSSLYLTSWETPDAAADYHDGQEEPDDWLLDNLIDLDTGNELTPVTTTTWRSA